MFIGNKGESGCVLNRKLIAVCSPAPKSGTSLVSAALASILSQRASVSLAELGSPCFFDALDMERKFAACGFTDYFRASDRLFSQDARCEALSEDVRSAFPRGPRNLWQGICWAVRFRSDVRPRGAKELLRLSSNLPGKYAVLDCSGLGFESVQTVMREADMAYIVVDPLPQKLAASAAEYRALRLRFPHAAVAVNPMNGGVQRSVLDEYLGVRDYICLPDMGAETVYKAQYAGVLPWQLKGGRGFLDSLKKYG